MEKNKNKKNKNNKDNKNKDNKESLSLSELLIQFTLESWNQRKTANEWIREIKSLFLNQETQKNENEIKIKIEIKNEIKNEIEIENENENEIENENENENENLIEIENEKIKNQNSKKSAKKQKAKTKKIFGSLSKQLITQAFCGEKPNALFIEYIIAGIDEHILPIPLTIEEISEHIDVRSPHKFKRVIDIVEHVISIPNWHCYKSKCKEILLIMKISLVGFLSPEICLDYCESRPKNGNNSCNFEFEFESDFEIEDTINTIRNSNSEENWAFCCREHLYIHSKCKRIIKRILSSPSSFIVLLNTQFEFVESWDVFVELAQAIIQMDGNKKLKPFFKKLVAPIGVPMWIEFPDGDNPITLTEPNEISGDTTWNSLVYVIMKEFKTKSIEYIKPSTFNFARKLNILKGSNNYSQQNFYSKFINTLFHIHFLLPEEQKSLFAKFLFNKIRNVFGLLEKQKGQENQNENFLSDLIQELQNTSFVYLEKYTPDDSEYMDTLLEQILEAPKVPKKKKQDPSWSLLNSEEPSPRNTGFWSDKISPHSPFSGNYSYTTPQSQIDIKGNEKKSFDERDPNSYNSINALNSLDQARGIDFSAKYQQNAEKQGLEQNNPTLNMDQNYQKNQNISDNELNPNLVMNRNISNLNTNSIGEFSSLEFDPRFRDPNSKIYDQDPNFTNRMNFSDFRFNSISKNRGNLTINENIQNHREFSSRQSPLISGDFLYNSSGNSRKNFKPFDSQLYDSQPFFERNFESKLETEKYEEFLTFVKLITKEIPTTTSKSQQNIVYHSLNDLQQAPLTQKDVVAMINTIKEHFTSDQAKEITKRLLENFRETQIQYDLAKNMIQQLLIVKTEIFSMTQNRNERLNETIFEITRAFLSVLIQNLEAINLHNLIPKLFETLVDLANYVDQKIVSLHTIKFSAIRFFLLGWNSMEHIINTFCFGKDGTIGVGAGNVVKLRELIKKVLRNYPEKSCLYWFDDFVMYKDGLKKDFLFKNNSQNERLSLEDSNLKEAFHFWNSLFMKDLDTMKLSDIHVNFWSLVRSFSSSICWFFENNLPDTDPNILVKKVSDTFQKIFQLKNSKHPISRFITCLKLHYQPKIYYQHFIDYFKITDSQMNTINKFQINWNEDSMKIFKRAFNSIYTFTNLRHFRSNHAKDINFQEAIHIVWKIHNEFGNYITGTYFINSLLEKSHNFYHKIQYSKLNEKDFLEFVSPSFEQSLRKAQVASALISDLPNSESLILCIYQEIGSSLIPFIKSKSVGHIFAHFFFYSIAYTGIFEILSSLFQNEENFQGIIEKNQSQEIKRKKTGKSKPKRNSKSPQSINENYNRNSPTQESNFEYSISSNLVNSLLFFLHLLTELIEDINNQYYHRGYIDDLYPTLCFPIVYLSLITRKYPGFLPKFFVFFEENHDRTRLFLSLTRLGHHNLAFALFDFSQKNEREEILALYRSMNKYI
ncbi:nad-dependent protein deacetylase sirtuin-(6/7) family member [Anaeramoeba ignava]|uniref:Nad-dependent protein deacetylase sirtuin-(6/7) family member n=1 Tax=Anaeramoeba ignava TaxID=1746090 RepID=A0A9Q0RC34_ANAIG|nr:nad-dependent protein deacetylase sirtuin-(6/7) family member [Anaeramoeba ignava]